MEKDNEVGAQSDKTAAEAWIQLQTLIKGAEIAMLTTVESDRFLRSRPMMTQQSTEDGTLWFFTHADHGKANEIERDPRVNVSYILDSSNQYLSVSGLAEVVQDESKVRELWKPSYRAWFPKGLEDPNLALLAVYVERAEYWDAPNSVFVELYGFAKAMLTGKKFKGSGSHAALDFSQGLKSASPVPPPA